MTRALPLRGEAATGRRHLRAARAALQRAASRADCTAKSFNTNFANIYGQIAAQPEPPSNVFAADPEAREVTERPIRDAGYEPVYAGDLENARVLGDHIAYSMSDREGEAPMSTPE